MHATTVDKETQSAASTNIVDNVGGKGASTQVVNDTDGAARDVRASKGEVHDATARDVWRYPETGISVLVVGAGMGGIVSALECYRKGHTVKVVERSKAPVYTGDNLTIQPSALSIFRHWPRLCAQIEAEQYDCHISYYRHTGEHIYGPMPPVFNDPENLVGRKGPHVAFMQGRVKFYRALVEQAERCGIDIEWGVRVVDFCETEYVSSSYNAGGEHGGIVCENGRRLEADVVIAADGSKTKSNGLVHGRDVPAKPSGSAVYRTAYPTSVAFTHPVVKEQWGHQLQEEHPSWEFWLGPGIHVVVAIMRDIVCLGLTHKDDGSSSESWNPQVDPDELSRVMEREAPGWHPAVSAILRTAPSGTIIHWKLMWRDLHEQWTSPGGHVVQVGDSAHSFLPQSGNGASQTIEDAITLATCLQLGGKAHVSSSTKAYNKLRYQRVSCAQKMAFVNSQIKHATDWDAIAKDPKRIRTRFPKWIWSHDPEAYAYQKFGEALHHILSGGKSDLENTNFPQGHVFRPWTIEEVRDDMAAGMSIAEALDGDWS